MILNLHDTTKALSNRSIYTWQLLYEVLIILPLLQTTINGSTLIILVNDDDEDERLILKK